MVVTLHLAMQSNDDEPADADLRKQLLDCSPCDVYTDPNGDKFHYERVGSYHLLRGEISQAFVRQDQSKGQLLFKLLLDLTDDGSARLNAFGRNFSYGVMSVNTHVGEPIGSGILSVYENYYVAGRFREESEAVRIAESLTVPMP